jgi:hypothetical protein
MLGGAEVVCVMARSPFVVVRDFAIGRWMVRTAVTWGGEGEEGSQGNWALGCECGELGVGRDTDCTEKNTLNNVNRDEKRHTRSLGGDMDELASGVL